VQTNRTVNGSLTFLAESAESAKSWFYAGHHADGSCPHLSFFIQRPSNKYSNLNDHNISTVPFTRYLFTYPDINVAQCLVLKAARVGGERPENARCSLGYFLLAASSDVFQSSCQQYFERRLAVRVFFPYCAQLSSDDNLERLDVGITMVTPNDHQNL
jgi:hypothetical protein